MDTVRKTIDVPATRTETANAWAQFIQSVLAGRRQLACDELACADPWASELVGFEDIGGDHTRVSVTLPVTDGDGGRELLGRQITHDLVLFWDYIDSGEYRLKHPTDAVKGAAVRDDTQAGRLTPHDRRPDPDAFSVRRSFRV